MGEGIVTMGQELRKVQRKNAHYRQELAEKREGFSELFRALVLVIDAKDESERDLEIANGLAVILRLAGGDRSFDEIAARVRERILKEAGW